MVLALMGSLLKAGDKPNLLFLFADDLTWRAVHGLSGEDIETPNMDRLIDRGTTFTHAYNSGAWHGAVCVASRTMLQTGLQLWRAKDAEPRLRAEWVAKNRLWPQRLRAAGYRTCFSGKWHLGCDPKPVFEEIRNFRAGGMPKDGPKAYERPIEGQPDPWNPADPKHGGFWEGGRHWSEVVADDFEVFLGKEDPRPWFMYLAFNAPHDPRQAPAEILERYPLERIELPPNFLPVHPHRKAMGAPQSLRDEKLAPSPRTSYAVKVHRREYFASITHFDLQIGRILDALDASPEGKSTVICLTSDHGLTCGEQGLMGKQNPYDAAVRVPFVIAGPGISPGRKVSSPIYLQDIMPTFLRMAGAGIPEDCDFQDLKPQLDGGPGEGRAIYFAYMDRQRMVQRGSDKLVLYPQAGVRQLFDLEKDPWERRDLAATPEGAERVRELFRELQSEQKRMGDRLDLTKVYPDLGVGR
ncbi:MAG: sulfatase-like hydrolase/transferase [Akkermansiaceae bacterium]|nr:sulfatase-like hydrolase/transferase [Akkermansiaceae bacterium]